MHTISRYVRNIYIYTLPTHYPHYSTRSHPRVYILRRYINAINILKNKPLGYNELTLSLVNMQISWRMFIRPPVTPGCSATCKTYKMLEIWLDLKNSGKSPGIFILGQGKKLKSIFTHFYS